MQEMLFNYKTLDKNFVFILVNSENVTQQYIAIVIIVDRVILKKKIVDRV